MKSVTDFRSRLNNVCPKNCSQDRSVQALHFQEMPNKRCAL